MRSANSIASDTLSRLGNYKCDNQMSFEDVDWSLLHKHPNEKKAEECAIMEEPEASF